MTDFTKVFLILFLMLGPFKIILPFARMTENASPELSRRIAIRGIFFSSLTLLLAALMGERLLDNYGIPLPILTLAGGLVLFLVALLLIIRQFGTKDLPEEEHSEPSIKTAIYPLAFPTIVTPYGIAAVIVFFSLARENNEKLAIGAIVLGIMIVNLLFMLFNRYTFKYVAVILPILGAILGILQVAIGLQIMIKAAVELYRHSPW